MPRCGAGANHWRAHEGGSKLLVGHPGCIPGRSLLGDGQALTEGALYCADINPIVCLVKGRIHGLHIAGVPQYDSAHNKD